jgi:outer membrane protein TolC
MRCAWPFIIALAVIALVLAGGCARRDSMRQRELPDLAPHPEGGPDVGAPPLPLDASAIRPMYTEVLAIDLPAAIRVAEADNIAIRQARLEVEAARGRKDAAVGNALPAFSPFVMFETVDGKARATEGNLVSVAFESFQAFLAIDWVLNPGRSVYEIIAARKRLAASEHQERAVVLDMLHRTVIQYHDLVAAQSRVATASQLLAESRELVRISELRLQAGRGVEADRLRAESRLAEREQDLALAMNAFYRASVQLALTLQLDSTVTLIPSAGELPVTTLVHPDIPIDELLGYAVEFRPDLASIRALVESARADRGAAAWGGFGPQFQTTYQIGGLSGYQERSGTSFDFSRQERFSTRAGWRLGLSTFGSLDTARAVEEQTILEAQHVLDDVRADVITAQQASLTAFKLIAMAQRELDAALEAHRLTQLNLKSGTMTTLEVLEAESALSAARHRHVEAVVGYNQAQAHLLAALGLMDESILGPQ